MTSAHAADESAANASGAGAGVQGSNPYAIKSTHHGVIPTVDRLKLMREWAAAHPSLDFSASSHATANAVAPWTGYGDPTLVYQGGQNGIDGQNNVGVMSGAVKVYLVFWGTQWGSQTTDANGNDKFSGDPSGVASAAQQMFKGIGTNNETWQADLTQWCDGPNVANGATSCPANANFIPYQTNIMAGVWYDNSAASPAASTSAQIANEAVAAAKHFGNTTAASNRYTYYIIMSPHGTNPDSYQGNYCAYHDSTSGGGGNSPYGEIAYSNQPYNTDSGAGCGVGFVNNPGTTDGYTMTLGHEWHEMMSDTFFPASNSNSAWFSSTWGSTAPNQGGENSDECAWISPGQAGGAQNVAFATGSYAEQASWSNDTQSCAISHAIVNHNGGGTPSASFSFSTNGLTTTFTDTSTDAGGSIGKHSWTFGDGSTSTATSPSHTYAAAGTFSVTETVTDSVDSKTSSATKSVTVSSGSGGGSTQLLGNPSIESTLSPWAGTSQLGSVDCSTGCSGESAHTGTGFAWLNGYGSTDTDTLSQSATITAGKTKATLQYYLHIDTAESGSTAYDTLTVGVYNSSGTLLKTLATYSNVNANSGYAVHSHDLSAYIGQKVTIKFTGKEDSSNQTSFVLDDITLAVQ